MSNSIDIIVESMKAQEPTVEGYFEHGQFLELTRKIKPYRKGYVISLPKVDETHSNFLAKRDQ